MPSTAMSSSAASSAACFAGGIGPVREQCEVQFDVRRCEIVDLEALNVLLDCRASRQQRGHHDHGAQIRRNAFAQGKALAESSRHVPW